MIKGNNPFYGSVIIGYLCIRIRIMVIVAITNQINARRACVYEITQR